jgi:6-phospho-beta-glucosidase
VRHRPIWVNFTNPCSIVTQYLTGVLGTEVIGICDYPLVFQRKIATFLGVQPASVQVRYFGLNHLAFVYDVTLDGRPVLHSLLEHIEEFGAAIPAQRDLEFLVVPTWNFVFDPAGIWARQRGQPNRASQLLKIESEFDNHSNSGQQAAQQCFNVLGRRECEWYELAVAPLLAMCLSEAPAEAIVNIPMDDVFALGITDTVVESNALVSAAGARALPLPAHVRRSSLFDYCRAAKRAENALLHGILQRDCGAIIHACSMSPMIEGSDAIVRYFDVLRASDPDMERILRHAAVPQSHNKQHSCSGV